jgi:hypothetical protein
MNKELDKEIKKFLELKDLWWKYIANGYHKQRDCEFTVSTEYYTYDDEPTYSVCWSPYVTDVYINKTYKSSLMCYKQLNKTLIKAMKGEYDYSKKVLEYKSKYNRYDDEIVDIAKRGVELFEMKNIEKYC